MRRLFASVVLSLALLFSQSCVPYQQPVKKTQLEIRAFQTREYQQKDTKSVMKAVLDVLQDDGFIVKNAVTELGLLTAQKDIDIERSGDRFFSFSMMGAGNNIPRWKKNALVEASINVSEFGDVTRVRANFQRKEMDNMGGVMAVYPVEDENFYQDFFAKVDKGLFIQREHL